MRLGSATLGREMAISKTSDPLVGRLPCISPFLKRRFAAEWTPGVGTRSAQSMAAFAAPRPARRALATPDERCRVAIPTARCRFQPGDDLGGRLGMLPAQGAPF